MFPLIAIGGVIGAVMSVAKGASWVSDQIGDRGAAEAGGKIGSTKLTEAQASAFAATLAAQSAGQTMPVSTANPASATSMTSVQASGPDENAAARAKAGVLAYSHIGEHHGHRAGAIKHSTTDAGTAAA